MMAYDLRRTYLISLNVGSLICKMMARLDDVTSQILRFSDVLNKLTTHVYLLSSFKAGDSVCILVRVTVQACPTFWKVLPTPEEELSWATHYIHCNT